jgi:YD repeat-containing protein
MKMIRIFLLMACCTLPAGDALGQYGLNFHHIYSWFSNDTPLDIFLANMKEHKVRSVRRTSAAYWGKERDGYLEFDTAGNLITHQTAARHPISRYYYDNKHRVVKIVVMQEGAPDTGSYTEYEYDSKIPGRMIAEKIRDHKGRLLQTVRTLESTRIKDTMFTFEKDALGKLVGRSGSYAVADTLYYDITDFYYEVQKAGKLLQSGKLDKPGGRLPCKAPGVTPATRSYLAAQGEAMKLEMQERYKKNKERIRYDDDDRLRLTDEQVKEYIEQIIRAYAETDNEKAYVPHHCYVYDTKGRLVEVISWYDGDNRKYTYDEAGRLKTAGDNIYHYDENGLLKAWYQSSNEVKLEYTFY